RVEWWRPAPTEGRLGEPLDRNAHESAGERSGGVPVLQLAHGVGERGRRALLLGPLRGGGPRPARPDELRVGARGQVGAVLEEAFDVGLGQPRDVWRGWMEDDAELERDRVERRVRTPNLTVVDDHGLAPGVH